MKTPITRRIFFWTLFVSYFCITTAVLLFVFGYRPDFNHKIFVYTGSLTLKTNPKSVSIKINDKEPKSRLVNIINDSYFITGLRPGQHKIDLTIDDFKSWSKNINIHSGLSTELWNILLIRKEYDRTPFDIENIDNFFPAPQENLFATTKQMGGTFVVNVFDTKQNESTNSFIFPKTTFTNESHENIEWSPNNTSLIIPILSQSDNESTQTKDYSIASLKTTETNLLSKLTKIPTMKSVRWDPAEKNAIYFLADYNLHRFNLDIDNAFEKSIIAQDILAYDFADDGLYVFTKNGDLLYTHDKEDASEFKKLTTFNVTKINPNYRLISYDTYRTALIDDNSGDLQLYNKTEREIYTQKIGSNIMNLHFSDDGKKLLFHSPFEIFVYFTRDSDTQPIRFENQQQSIIRFSKILYNVHFAKDYEHVIYTVNNDIKITELDYRGDRVTDTLLKLTQPNTTVINKHKMNKVLFIDSTDNHTNQLQSIDFPEKETLF